MPTTRTAAAAAGSKQDGLPPPAAHDAWDPDGVSWNGVLFRAQGERRSAARGRPNTRRSVREGGGPGTELPTSLDTAPAASGQTSPPPDIEDGLACPSAGKRPHGRTRNTAALCQVRALRALQAQAASLPCLAAWRRKRPVAGLLHKLIGAGNALRCPVSAACHATACPTRRGAGPRSVRQCGVLLHACRLPAASRT